MPTVPDSSSLTAEGNALPPGDAFVLLSKATLDLTFDDMRAIAEDLRARRKRFLQGQLDRPDRKKLPAPTAEEKEMRGGYVQDLLGNLKI